MPVTVVVIGMHLRPDEADVVELEGERLPAAQVADEAGALEVDRAAGRRPADRESLKVRPLGVSHTGILPASGELAG